jgi:hypothetical protein
VLGPPVCVLVEHDPRDQNTHAPLAASYSLQRTGNQPPGSCSPTDTPTTSPPKFIHLAIEALRQFA